jgi:hypothetical protein
MLGDRVIESGFILAMQEGFASTSKKKSIVEMPGSKMTLWERDGLRVVDSWIACEGDIKSVGHTLMWERNQLEWYMNYGGWYVESAIPFLKLALRHAYCTERLFYGGRGPTTFTHEDHPTLLYVNRTKPGSTVSNFSGEEMTLDVRSQRLLGTHWFHGGRVTTQ